MRKITLLMIAFISTMSLCLTSCLGDDDDESKITEADYATARQNVKGNYIGYLKSLKYNSGLNSTTKVDSIGNVNWIVGDSAISIYDFPVSMLAAGLDSTFNPKATEALKNAPNQTLRCYYGFYPTENFGNPLYYLAVGPQSITINLNVDGKAMPMTFTFQQGNSYFASIYSNTQHAIGMYLITDKVTFENSTLYNYKPMMFVMESKTKY